MSDNKTVYDIIQGIHQAAANGKNFENNENIPDFKDNENEVSEEDKDKGHRLGLSVKSQAFFIKINANKMLVTFETMSSIKDVLDKERYIESLKSNMKIVEKFLKSEYKKITGKTLSISMDGELSSMTQNINGTKTFTTAKQLYTIAGIPEIKDAGTEEAVKTYNSMDKMLKESWKKYIQ